MAVRDEQIKWLISNYPDVCGDNTEFVIRFFETACEQKGIEFPEPLKELMRHYKFEAITRKRREFVEPTKEQKEKQKEYRNYYK